MNSFALIQFLSGVKGQRGSGLVEEPRLKCFG